MNARFPEHPGLLRDLRHAEPVKRRPLLSVVVPCANQEEILPEANRRLHAALSGIQMDFEIVYVDDGSTDATPDILREFQVFDSRVRVVGLSKGFGRKIATMAGFEHASGDAVALFDAGLEGPPEILGEFVKRWRAGSDIVRGGRTNRSRGATRQSAMDWALSRLRNLADEGGSLDAGNIHLMDRKAVDALLALPERNRFAQEIGDLSGFSISEVRYESGSGKAKHSLIKVLRILREGLVKLSMVPLRVSMWTGFLCSGLSIVGILTLAFGRLFNISQVRGWTPGMIAVLFIGGVQLTCLGAIGEYIRRLYNESKRHPGYSVRERAGFGPQHPSSAFDVYVGINGNTN